MVKETEMEMSDNEVEIMTAGALAAWAEKNRPELGIDEKTAELLICHIGMDKIMPAAEKGLLFLVNMEGKRIPVLFDDVVEKACENCYELLKMADWIVKHPKKCGSDIRFTELFDRLLEEMKILDGIFEKTEYGREWREAFEDMMENHSILAIPFDCGTPHGKWR